MHFTSTLVIATLQQFGAGQKISEKCALGPSFQPSFFGANLTRQKYYVPILLYVKLSLVLKKISRKKGRMYFILFCSFIIPEGMIEALLFLKVVTLKGLWLP